MNRIKRLTTVLCLLLIMLLLPCVAGAEVAVEPEREVSLTVHAKWDSEPLQQAEFLIHQIATVDIGGALTVLPAYSQFQQLLEIREGDIQNWHTAALQLEQYILSENKSPTVRGATLENGSVTFFGVPQGLYLVLGVHHKQEGYVYSTNPFFVLLPSRDLQTHNWLYETEVNAKPERTEELFSLQIEKRWRDKFQEDRRPEKITLTLFRDGDAYQEITLPQNGSWCCTIENLSTNHTWYVEERNVPGYDSQITRKGNTFLITNTLKENTPASKLPQTGLLWWPVPWLLVFGIGFVSIGLVCRKKRSDS